MGLWIVKAVTSLDGKWIATQNGLNYILLSKSVSGSITTAYTLNFSLSTTTLSFAYNDNLLLVGLTNSSVMVYSLNHTTGSLTLKQVITTTHTANIVGRTSRFVACGSDDSISVYYFNSVADKYELNQSIAGVVANGCTALDFSVGEDSIAVGDGS